MSHFPIEHTGLLSAVCISENGVRVDLDAEQVGELADLCDASEHFITVFHEVSFDALVDDLASAMGQQAVDGDEGARRDLERLALALVVAAERTRSYLTGHLKVTKG